MHSDWVCGASNVPKKLASKGNIVKEFILDEVSRNSLTVENVKQNLLALLLRNTQILRACLLPVLREALDDSELFLVAALVDKLQEPNNLFLWKHRRQKHTPFKQFMQEPRCLQTYRSQT